MRPVLAALLMFALSAPAVATQPEVTFDGFVGLPYEQVAVEVSEPGESLDGFVLRLAPVLDAFTARTEWEACGVLAQDEAGRYAAVIGSVQASLSCATSTENVPEGFVAMGQSIHSHPATPDVRPTPSDEAIQRMHGIRGAAYKAVKKNTGSKGFSPVDFQAGPGYLVVAGKVLHQHGLRTTREVGRIENAAPRRRAPLRR